MKAQFLITFIYFLLWNNIGLSQLNIPNKNINFAINFDTILGGVSSGTLLQKGLTKLSTPILKPNTTNFNVVEAEINDPPQYLEFKLNNDESIAMNSLDSTNLPLTSLIQVGRIL